MRSTSKAPLGRVWQLHVDVNAWPIWQTDITAAQIEGALEPGASFDWTSYGFSVTSTVYDLPVTETGLAEVD